jgi:hypothetical protein
VNHMLARGDLALQSGSDGIRRYRAAGA